MAEHAVHLRKAQFAGVLMHGQPRATEPEDPPQGRDRYEGSVIGYKILCPMSPPSTAPHTLRLQHRKVASEVIEQKEPERHFNT